MVEFWAMVTHMAKVLQEERPRRARGALQEGEAAVIGREFCKRLRLLQGRSETVTTRFELNKSGQLVEHVVVETHDKPTGSTSGPQQGLRRTSRRSS